jgi:hypothetical protein
MPRRSLLLVLPVIALGGLLGRNLVFPLSTRGADRRIASENLPQMEVEVGRRLYAPTWLPKGGRVGLLGVRQGVHRVMQDFVDGEGQILCILSQEPRSEDRDQYHERLFVERAEVTVELAQGTAYLITGTSGERRLYWNREDTALILSSFCLPDEDMVEVASRVR